MKEKTIDLPIKMALKTAASVVGFRAFINVTDGGEKYRAVLEPRGKCSPSFEIVIEAYCEDVFVSLVLEQIRRIKTHPYV